MTSNLHPLMAAICEDILAAPKVLREAQAGRLSHDPSQTCAEKAKCELMRREIQAWRQMYPQNVYRPDDPSLTTAPVPTAEPRTARQTHGATARVDAWDQAVCELAKARETGADATTLRRLESAEEMARDAVYEARDIEPRPLFGEDE